MDEQIDRLCDRLRIKLHGIDRRFEAVQGQGMAISETSQRAVESQLDGVEQRISDNPVAFEAANARVKTWLDGNKAGFDASRASWKEGREVHLLNQRADEAEAYAIASSNSSTLRSMRPHRLRWRPFSHETTRTSQPCRKATRLIERRSRGGACAGLSGRRDCRTNVRFYYHSSVLQK